MTAVLGRVLALRLRPLLLLLVAAPLLGLTAILMIVTRGIEEEALRSELEERGRNLASSVVQNIGGVVRGEATVEQFDAAMDRLRQDRSLWYLVPSLRLTADALRAGGSGNPDRYWGDPDFASDRDPGEVRIRRVPVLSEMGQPVLGDDGKPKTQEVVEYLHLQPVSVILRGPGGSEVGTLELFLTLRPMERRLAASTRLLVGVGLAILAVAALAVVPLARRLTAPLEELDAAVGALGEGRSSGPLPEDSGTAEVRRLTTSFNRMARELEEKKRMAVELEAARELQARLFPRLLVEAGGYRALFASRPAREVGGDFFTEIRRPAAGSPWAEIALGDVSGKGMSAALLAATTHGVLSSFALSEELVPDLVRHAAEANRVLCRQTASRVARGPDGRIVRSRACEFVALALLRLDAGSGDGALVNAGQVVPIAFSPRGARPICAPYHGHPPLGFLPGVVYTLTRFHLEGGESLLLVSDGVTEAMSPSREELTFQRLLDLVPAFAALPFEERAEALFDAVAAHAGAAPQHDDATVILIERDAELR